MELRRDLHWANILLVVLMIFTFLFIPSLLGYVLLTVFTVASFVVAVVQVYLNQTITNILFAVCWNILSMLNIVKLLDLLKT